MKFLTEGSKAWLTGSIAVLVTVTSAVWIYVREFASPEINSQLHEAVGEALADQAHEILGRPGSVLIVSMKDRNAPELRIQMAAFEKRLKVFGNITIQDRIFLDPGDNPKYRPGSGLSAKRYLKIARKNKNADIIVSFVGAPDLTPEELSHLQGLKYVPKFVAEAHSPERLLDMFDKKALQAAIVPRFEFPAPGPRKPTTGRQWFEQFYQIVSPANLGSVTNAYAGGP
jgi:hypothetical protein